MQILSLIIIMLLNSVPVSFDEIDANFHHRLLIRHALQSNTVTIQPVANMQAIQVLRAASMNNLLAFASEYALDKQGFSYRHNQSAYSITVNQEVLFYTFSIDILKDNVPATRCFYEVDFRVNGGSFIRRMANLPY